MNSSRDWFRSTGMGSLPGHRRTGLRRSPTRQPAAQVEVSKPSDAVTVRRTHSGMRRRAVRRQRVGTAGGVDRSPNRGRCAAVIAVGGFVTTSGQKPWPSAGCFVAAYGQFFMAADTFVRHEHSQDFSQVAFAT